jgi:predicted O-methyltransferase YrrM
MDKNHIDLIYGLIISQKPRSILELGIGSGSLTRRILDGMLYNEIQSTTFECVDNFIDWNYNIPDHIGKMHGMNVIVSSEESFVKSCTSKYDFIVSDADHANCHRWIKETCSLLNDSGILIYHDVTNQDFPNLKNILTYFNELPIMYSTLLFNKSSKTSERCNRGLLIVNKK